MKATHMGLGDLLHSRQPFEIPKYQRSYAWEREQIDEFVEDLLTCFRARADQKESQQHFFGGVVSIEEMVGGTLSGRRYEVVDGQQRLATFTLTLSLIGKAFDNVALAARKAKDEGASQLAESMGKTLFRSYIEYTEVVNGKSAELLRVVLSKADREFFEAIVRREAAVPPATRDSHTRLLTAKKVIDRDLIDEVLKGVKNPADRVKRLLLLQSVIIEDCQVIHLVTPSQTEAYKLFQVLNDRGVNLSEGDLLRSSTLEVMESVPSQQPSVESAWDEILSGDPAEIELFLRAYFDSKQGKRASKRNLVGDFSRAFQFRSEEDAKPDPAFHAKHIVATTAEMRREIATFRELSSGEWPYEERSPNVTNWERGRLKVLVGTLKHTLALPLLLAASYLPEQRFAALVGLLERFVFRYITVCKAHAGKLHDVYSKQAVEIRRDPAAYDLASLKAALKALADERASDEHFAATLSNQVTYRKGMIPAVRYFLLAIEQHSAWLAKGAPGVPVADKTTNHDLAELEVEHIYPQSAAVEIKGIEPHKNRLGNLTFWSADDNKAAGNAVYAVKRPHYEGSNIRLNRDLATCTDWTLEALEQREKDLITRALKVFAVS
ncbi:MAG: DUF262 domain-containing protein [Myxococcales bacterium]|nr:DUF262 domain-containing protein [Myxococcales bacterium]